MIAEKTPYEPESIILSFATAADTGVGHHVSGVPSGWNQTNTQVEILTIHNVTYNVDYVGFGESGSFVFWNNSNEFMYMNSTDAGRGNQITIRLKRYA